ncbi:SHOCT domain-containing protein [Halovivax limisalsi]|uniref:SHOCT domain-containing protein n=1 Tax=Halovivax limisalsi TaxID=1453760 RepID=UPI001FFDE92D|nr:SHOCT domain-containing protein [Halovivax limisalsi]
MGSTDDGGEFSLMELFVVKFVLADVIIIAALVFAGPLYALAITALLVLSVVLVWYLTEHVGSSDETAVDEAERTAAAIEAVDPVTTLQERYASGDLSEDEFERRLDRLLDADERAADADVETKQLSLERE